MYTFKILGVHFYEIHETRNDLTYTKTCFSCTFNNFVN